MQEKKLGRREFIKIAIASATAAGLSHFRVLNPGGAELASAHCSSLDAVVCRVGFDDACMVGLDDACNLGGNGQSFDLIACFNGDIPQPVGGVTIQKTATGLVSRCLPVLGGLTAAFGAAATWVWRRLHATKPDEPDAE